MVCLLEFAVFPCPDLIPKYNYDLLASMVSLELGS